MYISSAQWFPQDNGIFITGSCDRTVKVWDTNTCVPVNSIPFDEKVYKVSLSRHGSKPTLCAVGTGMPSKPLGLCDISNSVCSHTLLGHCGAVVAVDWHPRNENVLVTGSWDGTVRLWDIRRSGTGGKACVSIFDADSSPHDYKKQEKTCKTCGYSPIDSVFNLSAKGCKQCRLGFRQWGHVSGDNRRGDGKNQSMDGVTKAHTKPINAVKFTSDGNYVFSAALDSTPRIWSTFGGHNMLVNFGDSPPFNKKITGVTVDICSGLRDTLFFPNHNGEVLSYDFSASTCQLIQSLRGHHGGVNAISFRKSTLEMYSAGQDGEIMSWAPTSLFKRPSNSLARKRKREADILDYGEHDWCSDGEDTERVSTSSGFIPPILR